MSVRSKRTFKSNQDLWQAFLSSDKEAFACLFEEYVDAMYAYGCKMTSDAELVKDAIQDVFVKLYKNRLSLRENVMIKGYLFVALKRTLLNPNRSLEKASCHFLMTAIRKTALYMLDS